MTFRSLGIVVPDAIVFQLREKLSGAFVVEMLDAGPAVGCYDLEFLRMDLQKPWHKRTSVAFKMPKHTDFIGKAFVGLRSAKRLVDPPIVADADLCPQTCP